MKKSKKDFPTSLELKFKSKNMRNENQLKAYLFSVHLVLTKERKLMVCADFYLYETGQKWHFVYSRAILGHGVLPCH